MRGRHFLSTATYLVLALNLLNLGLAADFYVDVNATGTGTGATWEDAFPTIREGIEACSGTSSDTVHVASGSYIENLCFKSHIQLLGGYPGGGGLRDAKANPTIIDGNNAGTVVSFGSVTDAGIDGFSIMNGKATYGGGIYCIGSSPTLSNNTFTNNSASYGAAIACHENSAPRIAGNLVKGNSASNAGGGISCWHGSSPMIIDNIIEGNTAKWLGGGVSCWYDSNPTISDNKILGNTAATYHGGGIYCYYGSSPIIINNLIAGNAAVRDGGGLYCFYKSAPKIVNCTVSYNVADSNKDGKGNGSALYVSEAENQTGILNCILWGSSEMIAGDVGDVEASYSDIQGGWEGTGNIDEDPLFTDRENGDYTLLSGSPCVDSAFSTDTPKFDMIKNPRVDDRNASNTGDGSDGDYYDMGALELQSEGCDYNNDGQEDTLYDLIVGIKGADLNRGIERALTVKLENAESAFDRGKTDTGCNLLAAFMHMMDALAGKQLTQEQVDFYREWLCCLNEYNWECELCE
ncbi:MAG: right-handed parallel beta-helix repeat-containing protein [Candidatus Coatesbacteria bacterium]|nr:right-handed parallel beta-helix repeat-containing protein [Candidatus Coatesbacteria bacterium]